MSEKTPRGTPLSDGRFVWQSSLALERIVNKLGATDGAFGVAVYVALCRISSREKNSPTIEATVQEIAGMARLSYPKTLAILDQLESPVGAIEIERRPRAKGQLHQLPHRYTLLALRSNAVKPARRNAGESGRLNGAGSTEQANQYSEIPKDSAEGRESRKEGGPPGPPAQPGAGGGPEPSEQSPGTSPSESKPWRTWGSS